MKIFFRRAFFSILFLAMALSAFENAVAQEDPLTEPEVEENKWEKAFIQGNINISEWFDSAAEGLDLFIVGKRVTKKKNESKFRIENITTSSEGKAVVNSWGLSVNPRLPNLEEYWHLKFATYDEREDQRNAKNAYLKQTPRQNNYGATVGVFKKLGNIRTAFQPRIELQDPLRVSHSLMFESVADQKTYEINPKIEFWATPDRGVGTFQALNFNFHISKAWGLTLINQGDYEERTHVYTVTNGASLGHSINDKAGYAYNLFFISNNRTEYHLVSYNISVAYSEIIYKRIMDFQIIPNLDFQEAVSFKGVAGITVIFNFNF